MEIKLTLKITRSWWLRYYLHGVVITCALSGREPNLSRLSYWIRRETRVKVVEKE